MLRVNWSTVQVYQQCEWTVLMGGMTKPHFFGISAQEIRAALEVIRPPRRRWRRIMRGVRIMCTAAQPIFNKATSRSHD